MPFAEILVAKIAERLAEQTIDTTIAALRAFAQSISGAGSEPTFEVPHLSTVSVIGIGRCGTNIALDVADTVYEARTEHERDPEDGEQAASLESSSLGARIRALLATRQSPNTPGGLFLIDPVILAADLDGDTPVRIQRLNSRLLESDLRFQLSNLNWLNTSGAGNLPIVGQYNAMLALLASPEATSRRPNEGGLGDWTEHCAYLVHSVGLPQNRTRLFFYLFSAGGGSGSGMASVLATAQQNAYITNLRSEQEHNHEPSRDQDTDALNDEMCSLGIAILPSHPSPGTPANAQHINAGRTLCSYLAQHHRFEESFRAAKDKEPNQPRRMFNALILVSNDLMTRAFYSSESDQDVASNKAEKLANRYIAQQIFNILTAQATIHDYDKSDPKFLDQLNTAGLGLGDTTRLDAADLSNCLSGPTAVAYAERSAQEEPLDKVFARAIGIPQTQNPKSQEATIEGISILPTAIDAYLDAHKSADTASALPLFRHAQSVVVVISSSEGGSLDFGEVQDVRELVDRHFPSAQVKRYAFVVGSSPKTSITLLISGSAFSTTDVYYHFLNYVTRCFGNQDHYTEIQQHIEGILSEPKFEPEKLLALLSEHETPKPVVVGSQAGTWEMKKLQVQRQYQKLKARDRINVDEFGLDDLLLTREDVVDALKYVHRLEHTNELSDIRSSLY